MRALHPFEHSLRALGFGLLFEGQRQLVHDCRQRIGWRASPQFRKSGFQPAGGEEIGAAFESVLRGLRRIADQPRAEHRDAAENQDWPAEVDTHLQHVEDQHLDQQQPGDDCRRERQDVAAAAVGQEHDRDDGQQRRHQRL